jgi:hypothetical protein
MQITLLLKHLTQIEDLPSSPSPFSQSGRRGAGDIFSFFLVPLSLFGRGARGEGLITFCVT